MKNVIEVKKLEKSYDNKFKLGPIDLKIPSGTIIGLIGKNGAGKTTFLKSLLNIINSNGEIKIFNKDLKTNDALVKEEIGAVLDDAFFPNILTPKEIASIMKGIYKNFDKELYFKYLEKFKSPLTKPLKTFSRGMQKKLEIITALAHKPKLLILDEPTSGLDPVVRDEILEIFMNFIQDDEHTILFSTHITSDLERLADEIIFINNGKILLNTAKDEILDNYGILKCGIAEFKEIAKEDIIRFRKNKYNYEVLVSDKKKISKKYPEMVLDKITLDDLMVLMIKGEKEC